jgi:hypothetical protein
VTRGTLKALVGLAAAVAGLAAPASESAAASLGSAKAQVTALRAEALRQASLVHTSAVAYQAAQARLSYLEASTAAGLDQLRRARTSYRAAEVLLQDTAVYSYTGSAWGLVTAQPAEASFSRIEARTAYEGVVVGDLTQALTQFQKDEASLAAAAANYHRQLRAQLEALRLATATREAALARAARLQVLLDHAERRLASLAAASRASAGPPVGDGLVRAVAAQLGSRGGGPGAFPKRPALERAASGNAARLALSGEPGASSPSAGTAPRPSPTTSSSSPAATGALAIAKPPSKGPGATTTTLPGTAQARAPTTAPRPTTVPATTPTSTTTAPATTTTSTTTAPATTTTSTTTAPATTPPPGTAPSTTSPTTSSPPTTTSPSPSSAHPPPLGGVWLALRICESGDNYQENTGNGFYGAYQFALSTWWGLGYSGRPDQAPYWRQDEAALRLQAEDGWSPWPACSAALGL